MAETERMSESRKPLSARFKEQLLGENFQRAYHIFCRIVYLSTFIVQFAILDVYLVQHHSLLWCLWIIPDLLVLAMFVLTAVFSFRHLRLRVFPAKHWMGELPFCYISWFLYAAILSAKFCIIYALPDSTAKGLNEVNFFGPNMLQTGLSLASIVLYSYVLTLNDTKPHSDQSNFIQAMIGSTYIDILDAVSFSTILLKDTSVIMHYHLDRVTLAIVSFNFLLPTEALLVLSKTCFGKFPLSRRNHLIHKVVYYILVNLPMFLVRLIIWHLHDQGISVFLVKNVLALALTIKDVHDFTIEVTKVITDTPDAALNDKKRDAVDPEAVELEEFKGNVSEAKMLREHQT